MKAVVSAFWRNPVIFLGVLQLVIAALIDQGFLGWPGLLGIAAITYLQRELVKPVK